VLHYAQEIFEVLKPNRWSDGNRVVFAPSPTPRGCSPRGRRIANFPELPRWELFSSIAAVNWIAG